MFQSAYGGYGRRGGSYGGRTRGGYGNTDDDDDDDDEEEEKQVQVNVSEKKRDTSPPLKLTGTKHGRDSSRTE